jgi:hypothetical protein
VYESAPAGCNLRAVGWYAGGVARGWESKAIESQQEDRHARQPAGPALPPEARERQQRAESVALALADTTAQLQAACRPAQRDVLRQRVVALQTLLAELNAPQAP